MLKIIMVDEKGTVIDALTILCVPQDAVPFCNAIRCLIENRYPVLDEDADEVAQDTP